jgi:hypothetical protein
MKEKKERVTVDAKMEGNGAKNLLCKKLITLKEKNKSALNG